jgi:lysophospholipase L1-like esterase
MSQLIPETSPRTRPKNRIPGRLTLRLGLSVASLLAALVLAEAFCRLFYAPSVSIRFEQNLEIRNDSANELLERLIENDSELFWRLAPNLTFSDRSKPFPGVVSNAQRLRERKVIPAEKPAGQIRILFVGDSCIFGFGVQEHEAIPAYLETGIARRFPGADVECINAGVPGYSLFQSWRYLETAGFDLNPDLIILKSGWNDQDHWGGLSDREHYEVVNEGQASGLLSSSRVWGLIRESFDRRRADLDTDTPRPRVSTDEFGSILSQVRERAIRRDVDLLLLIWPFRFNIRPYELNRLWYEPYQRIQYRFVDETHRFGPDGGPGGVDLIAAAQDLSRGRSISEIFSDHGHTTPLANKVFAEAIAERITPWVESKFQK